MQKIICIEAAEVHDAYLKIINDLLP